MACWKPGEDCASDSGVDRQTDIVAIAPVIVTKPFLFSATERQRNSFRYYTDMVVYHININIFTEQNS